VNKAAFLTYLDKVLLPAVEPGSILVMDNWCAKHPEGTVHHGEDVNQLVEVHGCSIFYLPSYSPDFNPIEFLFSKIKAYIKKLRPLTLPELLQASVDAVLTVTSADAARTFQYCGCT